jgi:chromosome condensin MukBEF MukE localization factor
MIVKITVLILYLAGEFTVSNGIFYDSKMREELLENVNVKRTKGTGAWR